MAKQTLNNGESGSTIRGKINSNFTELYAAGTEPTFSGGVTLDTPDGSTRYLVVEPVAPDTYSKDFNIAGGSVENSDDTYNFVVSIGHNLRAGTRIDTSRHAYGFTMEQSWFNGENIWAELHEEFIPLNTINGVAAGSSFRMSSTIMDVDTNAVYRYLTLGQFWIQRESTQSMTDGSKGTYFKVVPGQFDIMSGTEGTTENFFRIVLSGSGDERVATISVQDQLVIGTCQITTLTAPTIDGTTRVNGILNVTPTGANAEFNLNAGSTRSAAINLYSGGATDGQFVMFAAGGALGSSYSLIGHTDDATVTRGAILFDTRGFDPIRFQVGATGSASVIGLSMDGNGNTKIRGSFAANNKTPSTPALTSSTTLTQLMQALEDIGLIDYTP